MDVNEWENVTGSVEYELTEKTLVKCSVRSIKPSKVFAVRGKKEILLAHGSQVDIRETLTGFDLVRIKAAQANSVISVSCVRSPVYGSDPVDPEKHVAVELPKPENLVQQFARIARENQKLRSLPVMEPTPGFNSRYEIDDDDFDFEEDIAKKRVEAAKAQKERQKLEAEGQTTLSLHPQQKAPQGASSADMQSSAPQEPQASAPQPAATSAESGPQAASG